MLARRLAALAIVASLCCAGAARVTSAEPLDDFITRTRSADPDGLAAKPLSNVSQANCSAGNAVLAGIAEQNPEAVRRALSSAKERYDSSYKLIIEAAGTGAFKKPFNKEKLKTLQKYTNTDLSKIETREDLLRRIAAIVKKSSEALERIQNGKAEKDDLALVIENSTEITRLIAAFYDLSGV